MDADQIFKIANSLAFFSWIPLLIAPFNARIRNVLLGSYSHLAFADLCPAVFPDF